MWKKRQNTFSHSWWSLLKKSQVNFTWNSPPAGILSIHTIWSKPFHTYTRNSIIKMPKNRLKERCTKLFEIIQFHQPRKMKSFCNVTVNRHSIHIYVWHKHWTLRIANTHGIYRNWWLWGIYSVYRCSKLRAILQDTLRVCDEIQVYERVTCTTRSKMHVSSSMLKVLRGCERRFTRRNFVS